jgi:hypothetical protein
MFAVIAFVAIGLQALMNWGNSLVAMDEFFIDAVQGIKIFLFAVDLVCLVAFVAKEALVLLQDLWS